MKATGCRVVASSERDGIRAGVNPREEGRGGERDEAIEIRNTSSPAILLRHLTDPNSKLSTVFETALDRICVVNNFPNVFS